MKLNVRMITTMHLILSTIGSEEMQPPLRIFHAPQFKNPGSRKIERYFEDYKSQIKNRLAGIDQSTKAGSETGCKA